MPDNLVSQQELVSLASKLKTKFGHNEYYRKKHVFLYVIPRSERDCVCIVNLPTVQQRPNYIKQTLPKH